MIKEKWFKIITKLAYEEKSTMFTFVVQGTNDTFYESLNYSSNPIKNSSFGKTNLF
jgi:hypothetical protein